MIHMAHTTGTSVISALFEGFYNGGPGGIHFEAYTNNQYI